MAVTIDGTTGIDKVQVGAVDIGDLVATGTADATTFLRGDGTWGAVDTTPPTGYAEVGTYIVALIPTNSPIDANTTVSATSLYTSIWTGSPGGFASNSYVAMNSYQDTAGPNSNIQSLGLSGTWRTLTNIGNGGVTGRYIKTLVVRVS